MQNNVHEIRLAIAASAACTKRCALFKTKPKLNKKNIESQINEKPIIILR